MKGKIESPLVFKTSFSTRILIMSVLLFFFFLILIAFSNHRKSIESFIWLICSLSITFIIWLSTCTNEIRINDQGFVYSIYFWNVKKTLWSEIKKVDIYYDEKGGGSLCFYGNDDGIIVSFPLVFETKNITKLIRILLQKKPRAIVGDNAKKVFLNSSKKT